LLQPSNPQLLALHGKTNYITTSYPKGNFGRNQLLGNSISLSPLYLSQTSDLHVSNVNQLPSAFPLTSLCSSIVHYLSGTNILAIIRFFIAASYKYRSIDIANLKLIKIIMSILFNKLNNNLFQYAL